MRLEFLVPLIPKLIAILFNQVMSKLAYCILTTLLLNQTVLEINLGIYSLNHCPGVESEI